MHLLHCAIFGLLYLIRVGAKKKTDKGNQRKKFSVSNEKYYNGNASKTWW